MKTNKSNQSQEQENRKSMVSCDGPSVCSHTHNTGRSPADKSVEKGIELSIHSGGVHIYDLTEQQFNAINKLVKHTREETARELKYEPKKRWLNFFEITVPLFKTRKVLVANKETEDNLGYIKWSSGWRQYVFDDGEITLAEGCLYELFEKVRSLRLERESISKLKRDE